MKRLLLVVFFFCNLLLAFAENKIFALQANEKTVYCFQFDSGISFFIDLPIELKGYSDFGKSFLLYTQNDNMIIYGIVSLEHFLSAKQIKNYTDTEKIMAYYKWEKKYQEEEAGNIFKNDIEISTADNKVFGYYKFYRNIPIEKIKDTETVATEGNVFIYGNFIVYINKIIIKSQDPDDSIKILNLAFNTLKVTTEVFKPEDGWKIYSKL